MVEKISYTNKATIPGGIPYANTSPAYTITREIDFDDKVYTLEEIKARREDLFCEIKEDVDTRIRKDFERWGGFKLESEAEKLGHRFSQIDGVKVPHVTNIVSPIAPEIPNIQEYAYYGTQLDIIVKRYAQTGKWSMHEYQPQPNIKDNMIEMFELIQEVVKKNKLVFDKWDIKCHNKEFNYCGEGDLTGTIDGVRAFIDCKKTKTLSKDLVEKYFEQISAYNECFPEEVLVVMSPYGIKVETQPDKAFRRFLVKRGEYRGKFGV